MKGNGMTFLPGPTPGSDKAVRQHKAMAGGCMLPDTARRVKLNQRASDTGEAMSPGLTSKAGKKMKQ